MRAQLDELTAAEAALAMGVHPRRARRWLAFWLARGVAGIRKEPGRGRYGETYRVAADLPRRWRLGLLPVPREDADEAAEAVAA